MASRAKRTPFWTVAEVFNTPRICSRMVWSKRSKRSTGLIPFASTIYVKAGRLSIAFETLQSGRSFDAIWMCISIMRLTCLPRHQRRHPDEPGPDPPRRRHHVVSGSRRKTSGSGVRVREGEDLKHGVMDQAVGGDDLCPKEIEGSSPEVGDGAPRLADQQDPSGDIPRLELELPKPVEPTGRHIKF